jgi:hypothetical protein
MTMLFVGGGIYASYWFFKEAENVSLITAIVCYSIGLIIFPFGVGEATALLKDMDKQKIMNNICPLIEDIKQQKVRHLSVTSELSVEQNSSSEFTSEILSNNVSGTSFSETINTSSSN